MYTKVDGWDYFDEWQDYLHIRMISCSEGFFDGLNRLKTRLLINKITVTSHLQLGPIRYFV